MCHHGKSGEYYEQKRQKEGKSGGRTDIPGRSKGNRGGCWNGIRQSGPAGYRIGFDAVRSVVRQFRRFSDFDFGKFKPLEFFGTYIIQVDAVDSLRALTDGKPDQLVSDTGQHFRNSRKEFLSHVLKGGIHAVKRRNAVQ